MTSKNTEFIKINNSSNFVVPVWVDNALIRKGKISNLLRELQIAIHKDQTRTYEKSYIIENFGKVFVKAVENRVEVYNNIA